MTYLEPGLPSIISQTIRLVSQTVPLLHQALKVVSDTVAKGGRVLFVGTKRQASTIVADSATRCAQYYVNFRWLGGMLTNWKTISNSIHRLRKVEEILESENQGFTKKERLQLDRERQKLTLALGGIKDMGSVPDLIFVIDTNKEAIAIQEAKKLRIPVVAIVDTNSNPDNIDYPIPGNDDASRSIAFYCDLVARAVIDGIERQQTAIGGDLGDDRPLTAAFSNSTKWKVIDGHVCHDIVCDCRATLGVVEYLLFEGLVVREHVKCQRRIPFSQFFFTKRGQLQLQVLSFATLEKD